MNKKFKKCPICNVEGCQVDNNKMVWYHKTSDNRGKPVVHRWSINTGRMFTLKPTEDDNIV